jgi:hypothetical protein
MPHMVRALERRGGQPIESFDVSTFVGRIDAPLLIVHDTDDVEVPYVNGPRLSELLGARLLTTSGHGHRRILFAPAVVSAVVEFVTIADSGNSDRRCAAPQKLEHAELRPEARSAAGRSGDMHPRSLGREASRPLASQSNPALEQS